MHARARTHTHSWLLRRPRQRQMAELGLIVSGCCCAHTEFVRKVVYITHAGPDEKLLLITGQIQLLVNSCKVIAMPCGQRPVWSNWHPISHHSPCGWLENDSNWKLDEEVPSCYYPGGFRMRLLRLEISIQHVLVFFGSKRNMECGRGQYNKDTLMRWSWDRKWECQEKSKAMTMANKNRGEKVKKKKRWTKGEECEGINQRWSIREQCSRYFIDDR